MGGDGCELEGRSSFIVHSELYDGETQDLRELYRTFNRTGVDAEPGKQVEIIHPKEIKIEAQEFRADWYRSDALRCEDD